MTMKKQLFCAAPEGSLIATLSPQKASTENPSHSMLFPELSFLFLLYSTSACAALPHLNLLRTFHL